MAEKSDRCPLSPSQQRILALAFNAIACLQFSYYLIYRPFSVHGVDFTVLWRAAHQVCIGASPYLPPAILMGDDGWEVFKYPQFLVLLFCWLGFLPLTSAEFIWKVILLIASFTALFLSLFYLRRRLSALSPPQGPLAPALHLAQAGMVLAYSLFSPLWWSLELGQVGPLLLLLVLAAALCVAARRDASAGVLLSFATLVKLTPALLVLQGGLHRRWRTLSAAALTVLLYAALLFVGGFWREEWRYFTEVLPAIPRLTRIVSHSFLDLVGKVVAWGGGESAFTQASIHTVLQAAGVAFYLAVLLFFVRKRRSWEDCFPVALIGILVISPVVEGHHYVILWPAWMAQYELAFKQRLTLAASISLLFAWVPIFLATTFAHLLGGATMQYVPALSCAVLWALSIHATAKAYHRA